MEELVMTIFLSILVFFVILLVGTGKNLDAFDPFWTMAAMLGAILVHVFYMTLYLWGVRTELARLNQLLRDGEGAKPELVGVLKYLRDAVRSVWENSKRSY